MNRAFRFFIISGAVFGVLIVSLLLFDTSLLNSYLLNILTQSISSPSVVFTGEGLSLILLGARVATFKITLMKLFFNATFEQLSANCLSTSLFWGSPRCEVHSNFYGGTIQSDLTASAIKTTIHSAIIENVNLSQHPQAVALGIKGGSLNATIQDLDLAARGNLPSAASWQIKNLSLARSITIPSSWTGLPLPIVIPAFIVESLSGELNDKKIFTVDARSNLGTVRGEMALLGKKEFSLDAALSPKGLEELRIPLSFICSEGVLASGGKLRFTGSYNNVHCSATQ